MALVCLRRGAVVWSLSEATGRARASKQRHADKGLNDIYELLHEPDCYVPEISTVPPSIENVALSCGLALCGRAATVAKMQHHHHRASEPFRGEAGEHHACWHI